MSMIISKMKEVSKGININNQQKKVIKKITSILLVFSLLISSNIIPVFAGEVEPLTTSVTYAAGSNASSLATGTTFNVDIDVLTSTYENPIIKITIPKDMTLSYYPTVANSTTIAQNVNSSGVTNVVGEGGERVVTYNLKSYTNSLGFNISLLASHELQHNSVKTVKVELYNGDSLISEKSTSTTINNVSTLPASMYPYTNTNLAGLIRDESGVHVKLEVALYANYSNHYPFDYVEYVIPFPAEANPKYMSDGEYIAYENEVAVNITNGTATYHSSYEFRDAANTLIGTGKAMVYRLNENHSFSLNNTHTSDAYNTYLHYPYETPNNNYTGAASIKISVGVDGNNVIMRDFTTVASSPSYMSYMVNIKKYELSDDLYTTNLINATYGYQYYLMPLVNNSRLVFRTFNKTSETINNLQIEYNIPTEFYAQKVDFLLNASTTSTLPSSAIVKYKTHKGGDEEFTKNITIDEPSIIISDETDRIIYMKVTYNKLGSSSSQADLCTVHVNNKDNLVGVSKSFTSKILSGTGVGEIGEVGELLTYSATMYLYTTFASYPYYYSSNTSLNKGDEFNIDIYSGNNLLIKNLEIIVMMPSEYLYMGYTKPTSLQNADYTLTTREITVSSAQATTAVPAGKYTIYTIKYNDNREYSTAGSHRFRFKVGPLTNTSVIRTGVIYPSALKLSSENPVFTFNSGVTFVDVYDIDNDANTTEIHYSGYNNSGTTTVNATRAVSFEEYLTSSFQPGESSTQFYQYDSEGTYKYYLYNGLAVGNNIHDSKTEIIIPKTNTTFTNNDINYTSKWGMNLTSVPVLKGNYFEDATIEYMYNESGEYTTIVPTTTEEFNSVTKIRVNSSDIASLSEGEGAVIEVPLKAAFNSNTTVNDYSYMNATTSYLLNGNPAQGTSYRVEMRPTNKQITGNVFTDFNDNGIQEANESLSNNYYLVRLYSGMNTSGTSIAQTTTNSATGRFAINVLQPGTYTLKVDKRTNQYYKSSDSLFDENGEYTFTIGEGSADIITDISCGIITPRDYSLNFTSVTLYDNASRKIIPTILPVLESGEQVEYISSNDEVVTVGPDGTIEYVSDGTATITVKVPQLESISDITGVTTIDKTVSVTTRKDGCHIIADPYMALTYNATKENQITETSVNYSPSSATRTLYYFFNRSGYCNTHSDTRVVTFSVTSDNAEFASIAQWYNTTLGQVNFTATKAGVYTITATETWPHDPTKAPESKSVDITVDKINQETMSISGISDTVIYGDGPINLSTSGGTTNGDETWSITSGDAASIDSETGEVTILKAGTFTISVTRQGDDNYNEVTTTKTVTVNKKQLAVNIPTVEVYYGVTPEFEIEVTGFVNNETADTASNYIAPTINQDIPVSVGTHEIIASLGSADNYEFVYNIGNLVISRRLPVIMTNYSILGTMGLNNWYVSDVTIQAIEGFLLSEDEEGDYSESLVVSEETHDSQVTFFVKDISGTNLGEIYNSLSLGFKIDETMPVIKDISNDDIYYVSKEVEVTDVNLDEVYVNEVLTQLSEDGTVIINASVEQQSIVAIDKAGNTTTRTFYVYPKYTISYYDNVEDKDIEVSEDQIKDHLIDINLTTQVPERNGYNFVEWNTNEDGSGASFESGALYNLDENVNLYAIWETKDDTRYTVKHYIMNINGQYSENAVLTETKTGTTNSIVISNSLIRKNYLVTGGISYKEAKISTNIVEDFAISAEGDTIINLYYQRNKYSVETLKSAGINTVTGSGEYYFGQRVTVSATVNSGFNWVNWSSSDIKVLAPSTLTAYNFVMPASNVSITANASQEIKEEVVNDQYSITGDVKDTEGVKQANVQVVIMLGASVLGSTFTDEDGTFVLSNINKGYYNIVVIKDGIRVTRAITLTNSNVNVGTIIIPVQFKNSIVEVTPEAPKIVIDKIADILEEENFVEDNNKGFTRADQDIVDQGGLAEVKLTVDEIELTDSNDVASVLDEINKANQEVGMLIDISVMKKIVDVNGNETNTRLTELPLLVKVFIELPEELRGRQGYAIFRFHEGVVDKITEVPNEDGEYIEVNEDSINLYIMKFSTYALSVDELVEDVDEDTDTDSDVEEETDAEEKTDAEEETEVEDETDAEDETEDKVVAEPVDTNDYSRTATYSILLGLSAVFAVIIKKRNKQVD